MKNRIKSWLNCHPKTKQGLWFIGLWFVGLLAMLAITYPIRLLIKALGS